MPDIFSAFGLSASAGLNAYLPLLIVAVSARLGAFQLREPFDALTSWWVIGVLVVLLLIEIFVDKIPAVDTANDIIQTLIRPTAGAILFAASANVITDISPVLSIILGLLVAGGVHAGKMLARPAFTVSTAGTANPVVSTVEDVISALTALLSVLLPWLVMLIAVTGIVLFLWWRIRHAGRRPVRP
ncbi:MAG TPA: DUF4126 domain-containing protein [Chloroflexi bacterium]|nr:DUF4126 domain-containing protein [Chloroflexota bacterium]